MNAIYDAIADFEFSSLVFPMTQEYANWETDAVIKNELYRETTFIWNKEERAGKQSAFQKSCAKKCTHIFVR